MIRSVLCILAIVGVLFIDVEPARAQPTNWLVRAASAAREQFSTSRPRIVRRSIELEDSSLDTLKNRLAWFGIDVPLELKGDVTARLGVEVDLAGLNDAKSYRIDGSLSSHQLIVEGLTLQKLSAVARYVDGTLRLERLAATVPDPQQGKPAGEISGVASLQLMPAGSLTASLRLDGVPLEQFRRRIEALGSLSGGRLSGRLSTEAPIATIRDVTTWRGNGELVVVDLVAASREVNRVETALHLESGGLSLSETTAVVEGERVTGSGTLRLVAPFRFEVTIDVPSGELSRLRSLLEQRLPARWAGAYTANVQATGALRPWQFDATASVTGNDWLAAGIEVEHCSAIAKSDQTTLRLTQFELKAANGDITGSAALALQAPFKYDASLTVQGLQLAQAETLARTFDPLIELGGIASGAFTSSGTLSPQAMSARGQLTIDDLQLNGQTFSMANVQGEVSPTAIDLKTLELIAAGSRVTGKGRVELTGKHGFSLHFAPQRFDLATLEPVVLVALRDRSAVEQTLGFRGAHEGTDDSTAKPAPEVAGTATGEINANGDLLPFKLDALNGSLSFDELTVGGVTFDQAEIVATTENNSIKLSRVLLTKGNGRVEGEGSFGLIAPGSFAMSLKATNFAIDEARPLFGPQAAISKKLPSISGALDADVRIAGETQPFRLTNAQGTLSGDDIRVGQLRVDQFALNVATADDVINVKEILLVMGDGRMAGSASIALKGQQAFEATLKPQNFQIELLRPLFGEEGVIESDFPPVAGKLSGEITVKGRLAPIEMDAISGSLRSENGSISGVSFQRAAIVVASDKRVANVSELSAVSDFGTLRATGSFGLSTPYRYSAELSFQDFDLAAIGDVTAAITEEQRPDIDTPAEVAPGPGVLPVELEGLASIEGTVDGTVSPFVLTGNGQGSAERLVLDASELNTFFKRTTLTSPSFQWRYNEDQLTLADIAAGLGGGTLSGTAAVPLGDAAAGSIDLRIDGVGLGSILELPGRLQGDATGEITASLSPIGDDGERIAKGEAMLAVPVLTAGRVPAGDLEAQLSYSGDAFDYDVKGSLFEGPLTASGTVSLDAAERNRSAGHLQWTGGNLAALASAFSSDTSLTGRINAQLDYDLSAAEKATGSIEVSAVRSGTTLLTDRFDARLLWNDSELRIENGAGGYAGGTVSLAADLDASDFTRGTVEVLLRRADAKRAVGWIPGLEPLSGTLDMRLYGRLSDLWRWQGAAELGRGTYGPLAFSSAHVPLTIDVDPFRGALHVESQRAALRAAHGRGTLNISAELGFVNRLDLESTFTNLDAAEVIDGEGLGSRLAGGRISGTMQLSARNLRTISDLEGSLIATIEGSRAQNLPVIGSVFDVARLPTGGGGTVEQGEIRVFVRRGVARIDELTLAGASFRLFAEGTVALGSQRLALDVVADTTPGRSDRLIAAFLLRQLVDYTTPIGWLEQANRFISERAIYLRVTGTVDRPVVRVRPFEQLGQEGVRFFLNQIAAPVGGNARRASL